MGIIGNKGIARSSSKHREQFITALARLSRFVEIREGGLHHLEGFFGGRGAAMIRNDIDRHRYIDRQTDRKTHRKRQRQGD